MQGILYIVTTPIGNLGDLTPRAASTLQNVDFIAAEDTRVTLRLLNHLGIKKEMVSYHEHNARQRGEQILSRIQAGESCALCSDAGVPAISDPGESLVMDAHEAGIQVTPIPGACAAIAALSASGQLTGRFIFEGFLPQNRHQRQQHLTPLLKEQRTILLYEAPHKLSRTLDDLVKAFGADRGVTICRELTKIHEEIIKTTLGDAQLKYKTQTPRGEFVLVLEGLQDQDSPPEYTIEQAAEIARKLQNNQKLSASEAAKQAAAETSLPKSMIYKEMLR